MVRIVPVYSLVCCDNFFMYQTGIENDLENVVQGMNERLHVTTRLSTSIPQTPFMADRKSVPENPDFIQSLRVYKDHYHNADNIVCIIDVRLCDR